MKVSLSLPSEAQPPGGATAASFPTLAGATAEGGDDFLQFMGLAGKTRGDESATARPSLTAMTSAKITDDSTAEAAQETGDLPDGDSSIVVKHTLHSDLAAIPDFGDTGIASLRRVLHAVPIMPLDKEVQPAATGAGAETNAKVAEIMDLGQGGTVASQNRLGGFPTNVRAATASTTANAAKSNRSAPTRQAKISTLNKSSASAVPKAAENSVSPSRPWRDKTLSTPSAPAADSQATGSSIAQSNGVAIQSNIIVAEAPAKSSGKNVAVNDHPSARQNYFAGGNSVDATTLVPSFASGVAPAISLPVLLQTTSPAAGAEQPSEIAPRPQTEQGSLPVFQSNQAASAATTSLTASSPEANGNSVKQNESGRVILDSAGTSVPGPSTSSAAPGTPVSFLSGQPDFTTPASKDATPLPSASAPDASSAVVNNSGPNAGGQSADDQPVQISPAPSENLPAATQSLDTGMPSPANGSTVANALERSAIDFLAEVAKNSTTDPRSQSTSDVTSKASDTGPQKGDGKTAPSADDTSVNEVAQGALNSSEDKPTENPGDNSGLADPAASAATFALSQTNTANTSLPADNEIDDGADTSVSNVPAETPNPGAANATVQRVDPSVPQIPGVSFPINFAVPAELDLLLDRLDLRASRPAPLPPDLKISSAQPTASDNPSQSSADAVNIGQMAPSFPPLPSAAIVLAVPTDSTSSTASKSVHPGKGSLVDSAKTALSNNLASNLLPTAPTPVSHSQSARRIASPIPDSSPATPNGTPVANQQEHMKSAANVNEFAGSTVHSAPTPGQTSSAVAGMDASSQGAVTSRPIEIDFSSRQETAAQWMVNITPATGSTATTTANAASPVTPAFPLDSVERMITREVSMVRQSGAQELAVTLKVDAGTNLFLQLTNHNGQIEASVRCDKGASGVIDSHWGDLQESLARQNVQLLPLQETSRTQTNFPSSTDGDSGAQSTFQQKPEQNSQPAAEKDAPPSDEAMTAAVGLSKPKHRPHSRQGWEKWA